MTKVQIKNEITIFFECFFKNSPLFVEPTVSRSVLKCPLCYLFRENRLPFSYGLQPSPFSYVLTVFLQMLADNVFYET